MTDKEFKKHSAWIRCNINSIYGELDSSQAPIVGAMDMLVESVLLLAEVIYDTKAAANPTINGLDPEYLPTSQKG